MPQLAAGDQAEDRFVSLWRQLRRQGAGARLRGIQGAGPASGALPPLQFRMTNRNIMLRKLTVFINFVHRIPLLCTFLYSLNRRPLSEAPRTAEVVTALAC